MRNKPSARTAALDPNEPGDEAPPPPRRERRALSHVGGKVRCAGEETELFSTLEWALKVSGDSNSVREHVHGFHSYPARLHPVTARRLIEKLSRPGDTILDPFCGSGTVLVEGQLQGRHTIGVDLNPLAIELARFKTERTKPGTRELWLEAAEEVALFAEERRQARSGPTRLYKPQEREPYDPHILFELDGLSAGIAKQPKAMQAMLRLVLSSILTKVSKSLGDSSGKLGPRRLASGFAIKVFLNKAQEVCRQCEEYSELLPGTNAGKVILTDARRLTGVVPNSVDLVVSSPPYPGVFDYLNHHANRLSWLRLDAQHLARNEIGARRQMSRLSPREALEQWRGDFAAVLRALARVLKPGAPAALVIADSALGNVPLVADREVNQLALACGFRPRAVGSQQRPHFHEPTRKAFRGQPRYEHLIVLRRSDSPPVAHRPDPERRTREPTAAERASFRDQKRAMKRST
jgi:DNA modification methylase